jgi:hypothetical protein
VDEVVIVVLDKVESFVPIVMIVEALVMVDVNVEFILRVVSDVFIDMEVSDRVIGTDVSNWCIGTGVSREANMIGVSKNSCGLVDLVMPTEVDIV